MRYLFQQYNALWCTVAYKVCKASYRSTQSSTVAADASDTLFLWLHLRYVGPATRLMTTGTDRVRIRRSALCYISHRQDFKDICEVLICQNLLITRGITLYTFYLPVLCFEQINDDNDDDDDDT